MGVLDKFLDAIKVNDDYDDDEFLDDEFDDDFDDEKPKRRFFKKLEEDDDDLDDYEPRRRAEKQPAPKAAKTAKPQKTVKSPSSASASSSKVTPMRQVKKNRQRDGSLRDQAHQYGRYQRDCRYTDRQLYRYSEPGRSGYGSCAENH